MQLDTSTVTLITVLMVILECGILAVLWGIHRDIAGIGYWAVGALAIAAGALVIYLHGSFAPVPSIIAGNIVIVTGYVVTWWGIDRFFSRPPRYLAGLLLAAAAAAGVIYFGAIEGSARHRVIFMLSTLSVLTALRAYSMLQVILPETRFSQLFSGGVMVLQTVCTLFLMAAVTRSAAVLQPLVQMPIAGLIFLVLMVLSVAAVFAAVLLVNQMLQGRLIDAAQRDRLTGALRRHALEEAAEREISRCLRYRRPLCLLLLDLDHFKDINDRYGHHAGDEALRRFAVAVRGCLRQEDLFGRTGGEEFAILLPDTALPGATSLAERIRSTVETLSITMDGTTLPLTVSTGIAALTQHGNTRSELTRSADIALYRAKSEGRNRSVAADTLPAPRAVSG